MYQARAEAAEADASALRAGLQKAREANARLQQDLDASRQRSAQADGGPDASGLEQLQAELEQFRVRAEAAEADAAAQRNWASIVKEEAEAQARRAEEAERKVLIHRSWSDAARQVQATLALAASGESSPALSSARGDGALQAAREELQRSQEQLEQLRQTLQTEVARARREGLEAAEASEAQVEGLRDDLERAGSRMQGLEAQLLRLTQDADEDLQEAVARARGQGLLEGQEAAQASEARAQRLRAELERATSKTEALQAQTQEAEEELQQSQEELAGMRQRAHQLQEGIAGALREGQESARTSEARAVRLQAELEKELARTAELEAQLSRSSFASMSSSGAIPSIPAKAYLL